MGERWHNFHFVVTLAEIKASFEPSLIDAFEGDILGLCVRLGGMGWLVLQREITLTFNSDGGEEKHRI